MLVGEKRDSKFCLYFYYMYTWLFYAWLCVLRLSCIPTRTHTDTWIHMDTHGYIHFVCRQNVCMVCDVLLLLLHRPQWSLRTSTGFTKGEVLTSVPQHLWISEFHAANDVMPFENAHWIPVLAGGRAEKLPGNFQFTSRPCMQIRIRFQIRIRIQVRRKIRIRMESGKNHQVGRH